MEKPSSKPSTANSLRELLQTVYLAWFSEMWDSGLCLGEAGGREKDDERGKGRGGEGRGEKGGGVGKKVMGEGKGGGRREGREGRGRREKGEREVTV